MTSAMRLSVVVPTYNERDTIARLLVALESVLADMRGQYEILVVDDASPDGTANVVRQCMQHMAAVQLVSRQASPDLSSAVMQGLDQARGDCLVVMDADLQHDPEAVLCLLSEADRQQADIVVATRYAKGGSVDGWGHWRRRLSRVITAALLLLLPITVSDPLSGFFLLRRAAWHRVRPNLQVSGFKLLLAILVLSRGLRVAEVGYRFSGRQQGASKFRLTIVLAFLSSLVRIVWQYRFCEKKTS